MKIRTREHQVERSGVITENNFTIKTTAKAFEILSSGLYSDPILAIVRELACNAYDSHKAAQKEHIPFKIHLPNHIEPYFSIQDFGTGLSDEDVMHLYTTYFESTKSDSNDFIGALGLGSKSPFSYTNCFEVTSTYQGKKRIYSIFLNEQNVPSIARMGVGDTDQPNGFEVKITVKPSDFFVFQERAQKALMFFDPQPTVVGSGDFRVNKITEPSIKNTQWIASNNLKNKITAVQGNVGYRVDIDPIIEQLSDKQNLITSMLELPINFLLFFNIGELDVSANREEIRYDKQTVNAIIKKLEIVQNEFIPTIESQLNYVYKLSKWDCYAELRRFFKELFNISNELATTTENGWVSTYWNKWSSWFNKAIRNDTRLIKSNNIIHKFIEHSFIPVDISKHPDDNIKYHTVNKAKGPKSSSSSNLRKITPFSSRYAVIPKNTTLVVVDDIVRGGKSRTGFHFNVSEDNYEDIIFIKCNYKKQDQTIQHKKELHNILKQLGNPRFIRTSTLDSPPPRQRQQIYDTTDGIYRIQVKSSWNGKAKFCPHVLNNPPKSGLYILLDRGTTPYFLDNKKANKRTHRCTSSSKWDPVRFNGTLSDGIRVINSAFKTNYTENDVYGVSPKVICSLDDNNWIDFFQLLKESLYFYKQTVILSKRLEQTVESTKFKYCDETLNACKKVLTPQSPFLQYIQTLNQADNQVCKIIPTVERIDSSLVNVPLLSVKYLSSSDVGIETGKSWNKAYDILRDVEITPLYDIEFVKERYPLLFEDILPQVEYAYGYKFMKGKSLTNILQYINLIDLKHEQKLEL